MSIISKQKMQNKVLQSKLKNESQLQKFLQKQFLTFDLLVIKI